MKEFSEIYEELAQNRNIRVYEMAEYCKIAPQSLYQILNGKRKPPSSQLVEKIAVFMQLDPKERDRLVDGYFITTIGKEVYQRRKSVTNFFNTYKEGIGDIQFSRTAKIEELPSETLFTNSLDIVQTVYNMMFSVQKDVLYLYIPPTFPMLANLIRSRVKEDKDLHIEHIFFMKNGKFREDSEDNALSALKNLIPIYMSASHYRGYYYHEGAASFMFSYPFYVICDEAVLQIAADFKSAILLKNKDIIKAYVNHFTEQKKYTWPFDVELSQQDDESRYQWNQIKSEFQSYRYYPFLTPLMSKELLRDTLVGQRKETWQESYAYYQKIKQKIIKADHLMLFSFYGLQFFIDDGRLLNIKGKVRFSYTLEQRIELLKKLREAYGKMGYRMLKGMFGGMDPIIQVLITPEEGYIQIFDSIHETIFLKIRNAYLLFLFKDYFEHIPENLYYSEEEALDLIDQMIEKAEKKRETLQDPIE